MSQFEINVPFIERFSGNGDTFFLMKRNNIISISYALVIFPDEWFQTLIFLPSPSVILYTYIIRNLISAWIAFNWFNFLRILLNREFFLYYEGKYTIYKMNRAGRERGGFIQIKTANMNIYKNVKVKSLSKIHHSVG